jgi:glycosyltransferase involved in cell wall biosynthesis
MIKVGIWFNAPAEYSGGVNYFKNLLYALSLVNDGSVSPYVFISTDMPELIVEQFEQNATVVRTNLLRRGTFSWMICKALYKLSGSMILVNTLLKSYDINILSHVWFAYKGRAPFKVIAWIPDFQYLHLPHLFPTLDVVEETRQNKILISQSNIVILSSYNALEDFKSIAAPEHQGRGTVLQFVSQPSNMLVSKNIVLEELEKKYGFKGAYFFLPNQFWEHKNHKLVLQAVKLLKDRCINILVLCTGHIKDLRKNNTEFIDGIYDYIGVHNLQDQVKILGLIDYDDVLVMMKNSIAVINPSRFEGWSSSVEEAKSMDKLMILSNIDVHIEQNPLNRKYFDHNDVLALSQILEDVWNAPKDSSYRESDKITRQVLKKRTIEFGKKYLEILKRVND